MNRIFAIAILAVVTVIAISTWITNARSPTAAPASAELQRRRDHEAYLKALETPARPKAEEGCRAIRQRYGDKAIGQLTYDQLNLLRACDQMGY